MSGRIHRGTGPEGKTLAVWLNGFFFIKTHFFNNYKRNILTLLQETKATELDNILKR